MGQKFKLSEMITNSWFYKLKDMSKAPPKSSHSHTIKLKKNRSPPPTTSPESTVKTSSPPPQCGPRKSYHFTRDLPLPPLEDPPLSPLKSSKSSPKKSNKKITISPKHHHNHHHRLSVCENDGGYLSKVDNALPKKAEHFDIIIDVNNYKYKVSGSQLGSTPTQLPSDSYKIKGFDFQLPRIITKPKQPEKQKSKLVGSTPSRRFSISSSPVGVRLKINSPRMIMGRIKQGQNGNTGPRRSIKKRRSISESFAVVKSSDDPQRDFRESMVEMIVQNNLRGSKDLEDLLACYLSLNSDEYHDVIIKVFKQIWHDLSGFRHKRLVHN